jgi:3-deoxy-D-manno-octulosonic acid kinase
MTSGRRIVTASGAILSGSAHADDLIEQGGEALFEPSFWEARSQAARASAGRGAAWFVGSGSHHWVLRHYRRGGLLAPLLDDRYAWLGEDAVRAFAEFRLLARLAGHGLPVPTPIAARYRRSALCYRCDLLTQRIEAAQPLSARLAAGPLEEGGWREIGSAIARLHVAGADHADLNAHNVLIDGRGAVSVIDFDRGRLRAPGAWRARNLARLQRSLVKISRVLPEDRFSGAAWRCLLDGYAAATQGA